MSGISYDRIRLWLKSKDGQLLIKCILCVFAIGMAAHAYAFLGPIFSHDSMACLYADTGENQHKIALGRIFAPLYRALTHGSFGLPWLIGLFSLLWISLSVYVIAKIFRMRSLPMIALSAGIFATNATVSAMTATYIYELDIDMFALLTAVLSVWCWQYNGARFRTLALGALFGAISMGLYQSYICVTITLIMMVCIMRLLERDSEKTVLIIGLKGIAMLIASAILYFVLMNLVVAITGISLYTDSYNSVTNVSRILETSLLHQLLNTYINFARYCARYALHYSGFPTLFVLVVTCLLFIGPGIVALRVLFSRSHSLCAKLMLLALCLLLPLAMNFANLLNGGSHTLMHYAFALIYLLALLVMRWALRNPALVKRPTCDLPRFAVAILLATVLLSNIQASNAMYLQKDLERQTTLSTLTRVVDQMEEIDDYEAGTTPVAICLFNAFKRSPSTFNRYSQITGMQANLQVSYRDTYNSYFRYILNEPVLFASDETIAELSALDEVQAMPAYPDPGYVRMLDGTLIVKLS